jgi:Flp pilus assembly protein TadD
VRLNLSERAKARLTRTGLTFLAEFLGVEVERHPGNLEALAELGHALTRLGRVDEGLDVDRRLVRLAPENSTVHYNLACSLALLRRPAESLAALERAIELGYDDAEHLLADEDLATLRDDSRFRSIVQRLRAARPFPV